MQDPSRAVVSNARALLTDTATGVVRRAESNADGIYYFGAVPVGAHTLVVEASGFNKWEGSLSVQAGQIVVVDPVLEIGSLEITLEVTEVTPVLTTQGGQVSDSKDALRIHNLPLNGRQISNLFDLTPGVEGGGNPRVNGMKVGSTEMTYDGISYVDRFRGGIARMQPGLETVQEFRIETAGSGAQYSRPATVELVTRSGTNEIHGALFESFRNNAGGLRARRRPDGNRSAKYIRNEYGGWAGGPVIKNKTFWFFDWEGLKLREEAFAIAGVPTAALWDGDLSEMTDFDGNQYTIYDPLTTAADGTRLPFDNNLIPANRVSQFAKTLQSITASPNGPNAGGNPWVEANFQGFYPRPENQHTFTIKLDHVFSEKDILSGRYTQSIVADSRRGGRFGYPSLDCTNCGGSSHRNLHVYSTFARWNHIFTPAFLNELQLSAHRTANSAGTLGDNVNWPEKLGLPNPFGATGWPTICTDSYSFVYSGCWGGDSHHDENLTAFQIDENVTWIKGKHTLKAGFKGRQEYNNQRWLLETQGFHASNSDWTAQFDPAAQQAVSYTGAGFATLLLGLPSYISSNYNRGYFYLQQKELGLYFNDTYKASSRLTLDLGLRWDAWVPYKEKYDRLVAVDLNNYAGNTMQVITPHNTTVESMPGILPAVLESWKARGMTWVTADSIGYPGSLLPGNWGDFGPRLGLAYRVTDKWVLRAGYGIYFWPMPLQQVIENAIQNPPLNLRFQMDYADRNGAVPFYSLSHAPAPDDYFGKADLDVNHPGNSISSTAQEFFPWDAHHWADDTVMNWAVTIERELMKDTSLRLSYIGNHGYNLEQRWQWNDPESEWNYQARTGLATNDSNEAIDARRANPNWSSGCCSNAVEHNGYSNTHSGQVELERRFSQGLALQVFYVYARVLTTSDSGSGSGFGSFNAAGEYAGSSFAVPENQVILGAPNLSPSQRLRLGYYNSSEVPPHRVRWNGIYELPFGRGKKFGGGLSKRANLLIGGWQVAWIGALQSGNWSSVSSDKYLFGDPTLSKDQRLTMTIFGSRQRLWFKGDFDPTEATDVDAVKLQALVPVDRSQRVLRPLGPGFDNRLPQQLADGTIRFTSVADMVNWNARAFFLGPVQWNQDFSVFKYFDITERVKARFTADFFNVFNHPNDERPDPATGLQDLTQQSNDPRIIQFSLRLEF